MRDLRYLAYRCYTCGRLITKLELEAIWDKAEKTPEISVKAICPCGGNKVSPTNPLWWEELLFPRVWKLWWFEVALPWLRKTYGFKF